MEKEWLVIGAGPAGIATVGKLLDHGISQTQIGWLDPLFQVGDLGTKWQHVPANTRVSLFLKFFNGCRAFKYPQNFPIDALSPKDRCLLKEVVTPLQWITNHLKTAVSAVQGEALGLTLSGGVWEVKTSELSLHAKNVVLATGADPKTLPYTHPPSISVETALDPKKLAAALKPSDTVAVFGASHSAVLILSTLAQIKLKKIYNFYRSPHLYAIELDDWIVFDSTGLKGFAADWARRHLDGTPPENMERVHVSDPKFEERFALCTQAIYAVGFERRKLPVLEQFQNASYQKTTGIIAPGLFGVGIAYPQVAFDRLGNLEHRVGLWKFLDYLNTAIPLWMKYTQTPSQTA